MSCSPSRAREYAVSVGSPQVIGMLPYGYPATVTAVPGAGGTLLVEYSTSLRAEGDPAGSAWQDWPPGTVAAVTSSRLESPVTALRVTALVAAGAVEIVG